MTKKTRDEFKSKRDYSISFVRCVAMIFIVACHIMQRDGFATDIGVAHIEWAFWFNIGVQMFLFISGYLHGKKIKINTVYFLKKALSKILIDYYIFLFVMLIVIHYSPWVAVENDEVIGLVTLSKTISGLGHLWFVSTIMFCYLLLPIFLEIINEIEKRNNIIFGGELFVLLLVVHIVIKRLFDNFNPSWINCFVLGIIYSRLELRKKYKYIFTIVAIILCLVIIPIQFRIDYWPHGELSPFCARHYKYFCNYGHVFGGITIVLLLRTIYKRYCKKIKIYPILDWTDKYSYDVYLVHHIFVQSAFACVEFITNRWIALPIAIVLTILFSMLLYFISSIVRNKSIELYNKLPN